MRVVPDGIEVVDPEIEVVAVDVVERRRQERQSQREQQQRGDGQERPLAMRHPRAGAHLASLDRIRRHDERRPFPKHIL